MDAADLVYMKCDVQLVKVGDDKEAFLFIVRKSQAITQINHRDHRIPRHKYAFHAGV